MKKSLNILHISKKSSNFAAGFINRNIRYSYDMRDMLTETRNKHFSERLFYADSLSLLPQSVAPCRNGNIAAAHISQLDSIYTFAYSYDPLNRLISSVRIADAGTSPSEQFSYDASGNIIFLTRYNGRQKIDSLVCRYKNDGHQLVTVTDEGNDDDTYEVIEYHTEDMLADTSMWYDANGNLVYDEDRGISVIHYNVLNLPDTVQFINGNQIVNLYDAVGRKYRSITYIVPETAVTPRYEIMQYGFDIDTVEYMITEYAGTIENHYSRTDTTRRIHNATGYYTNNAYYHYIKDHLGNICAVVHSTADTLIQGTIYYASGIPMAYSFGRDKQPYLYNGKEFIEAHGLNTYDYGFRGYYATIGRFTSIDPLAESTPWQSPYSYAGNRFINAIDWMGLGGMTGYSHDYNLIVVNEDYDILYVDMNHWDQGVYMCDEEGWEFTTYWDILRFELIGSHGGGNYHIGDNIKGKFYSSGGGYYNKELGRWISYGIKPVEDPILMNDIKTHELLLQVCDIFKNDIFEYNLALFTRLAETAKLNTEYVKFLKSFSTALTIAEGYNLFKRIQSEGWTLENISDAVSLGLGIVASKNPEMLIILICLEGYKTLGQEIINIVNTINIQYGNYNYIMDVYWNGY